MVITHEFTEAVETPSQAPSRKSRRSLAVVGACVLLSGGVAAVAALGNSDSTSFDRPAVTASSDVFVRDLVTRGIVPAATLDDGSQVSGIHPQPASRSSDDVVRDLVTRGVVPAATLGDGTQITEARPMIARTHDEILRDLVARGLVPAATLDDDTQIN